jgi:hypothetical protein
MRTTISTTPGLSVDRDQDRPAVPDRPAGVAVVKMHTQESLVGPALLRFPAGAAVARRQDRPAFPDRPSGVRLCKMHTQEGLVGPALLRFPVSAAVARRHRIGQGAARSAEFWG